MGDIPPDPVLPAQLLQELDRLEELLEDMEDVGVFSREAAERRMVEIDAEIERLSRDEHDPS